MKKIQSAGKTIFNVLKYIVKNNNIWRLPFVIAESFLYHIVCTFMGRTIVKKTFNGKNIFLYPDCNVSSMLVYAKIPDKEEINLLRGLAEKEMTFFDIGANVGFYSIALSDKVDNIIAFEPHPFTASRCRKNFVVNNLNGDNVKEIALSSQNEKILFSDYGSSSTVNKIVNESENSIEVQSTTLDNFVVSNNFSKESKYLVKIDVEGFELQVLEGAQNFLKNYGVRAIVFESFGEQKELVSKLLEEYGFKIKRVSTNNYYATKN